MSEGAKETPISRPSGRELRPPFIRGRWLLSTNLVAITTLAVAIVVGWLMLSSDLLECAAQQQTGLAAMLGKIFVVPLVWLALHLLRQARDRQSRGCEIVLFRRFGESQSKFARESLAPILGSYGRVRVVADRWFDESGLADKRKDFVNEMPSSVAEFVGGVDDARRFSDSSWKTGVAQMVDEADIAVIDISEVTDNVVWEIARCYRRLPPHRIIFIAERRRMPNLQSILRRADIVARDSPEVLQYEIGGGLELELRRSFYARMQAIVEIEAQSPAS